MALRRNSHSVTDLRYHVVFCPRYRHAVLSKSFESVLARAWANSPALEPVRVVEGSVEPDHVHLILSCPPDIPVSKAVGLLKRLSTLNLLDAVPVSETLFRSGRFWSRGYYAATVGEVSIHRIRQYVRNQGKPNPA